MTYAEFLLFFLVVPTGALLLVGWVGKIGGFSNAAGLRYHWAGVALLAGIAFVWTTPWDNYLIARGVWDSPPDRIAGRILYVPLEEYAFFILMPLFNGTVFALLMRALPAIPGNWRRPQTKERLGASLLAATLMGLGIFALGHESGTYLGLTLVWFTPPLLVQWLFDPAALFRGRKMILWGTLLPLLYFAVVDSYAIREQIWQISQAKTSGLGLPFLPLEEIIFFGVTSLLLTQGLVLWHSLRPSAPSG